MAARERPSHVHLPARGEPASIRGARLAVVVVFVLQGISAGNWFVRIPAVQQQLGLGATALGLSLLGLAVGSLLTMPLTGWLVQRFGSRPVVRLAVLLSGLAVPLPALAWRPWLLFPALLLVGVAVGLLDVSMNAQAVAVELRYGRPIMSGFHGMYSVGGLLGSVAGGAVAAAGIGPRLHLLGVGAVFVVAGLLGTRTLLPAGADLRHSGPAFARPSRDLAALGAIAFCALLAEGAMGDWSALYLHRSLATGSGLAATGYAVFSITMALGRLAGDRLALRVGPRQLLQLGGGGVALGLGAGLLLGSVAGALLGFACTGAGLATVFPLALSLAGRRAPAAGPAIAAVSSLGYLGFLAGPPVIGLIAGAGSLRVGLGVVVLLGGAIALLPAAIPSRS